MKRFRTVINEHVLIYFLILCFRVVCGICFFAVGIIGSSDLEPAFARISAISFPS